LEQQQEQQRGAAGAGASSFLPQATTAKAINEAANRVLVIMIP
jgi:hypothetical protein